MTTLLGAVEPNEVSTIPVVGIHEVSTIPSARTKKYSWLPVLTVLFLISYGLMTMLIVEQGQTIESQRALIRELFRDSTELSAVKMKANEQRHTQALAQSPSTQTPSSQTPSTQAAPRQQAPSTQVEPQHRADNQVKPGKPHFQIPSKPAADLGDNRRALITI